jgi:hypothetical protein
MLLSKEEFMSGSPAFGRTLSKHLRRIGGRLVGTSLQR